MDKATLLAEQYADASELATRGEFNEAFTSADRAPHEWVFGQMARHEGGRVLDLGTGTGTFWTSNASRIPDDWTPVVADFSRGMVGEAREAVNDAGTDVEAVTADAEALPLADDSTDAVLALLVLYHPDDRAEAIEECHRVLAPGGRLYASTGHHENSKTLYDLVDEVADGGVEPLAGGFTSANGASQLEAAFDEVERRWFRDEVRVDDPDAIVAYALSLPLEAPALSGFDPSDAEALREVTAERIESDGAITWRKDTALFVATKDGDA